MENQHIAETFEQLATALEGFREQQQQSLQSLIAFSEIISEQIGQITKMAEAIKINPDRSIALAD
ncbi:hypothetical protein IC229_18455 [Spirosoma sp. BT702]|uniref:Uncharacterized protein n=1 Tax=Spirosoma profusum TaxID=2771354 RepID=A0A926Y430_9BACT|nr:hypothetical protein [Spirosoma profusum]MBD2702635.1 hypothetical protein [Spirosoma profusum]